jgi:hypothetical protein
VVSHQAVPGAPRHQIPQIPVTTIRIERSVIEKLIQSAKANSRLIVPP